MHLRARMGWALLMIACAFMFVVLLGTANPAHAAYNFNTNVKIVAEIQADGSAIITDTRRFTANSGTEYYLSWGNLRDAEVKDTNVVLDDQQLTNVGAWDIDQTLTEKAGKFGMRDLGDQKELCFGFGEYGEHTAVMTYHITNFVKNLEDGAQAVYWEFIPKNTTDINHLYVALTNNMGFEFTHQNSQMWAFGFSGTTALGPSELIMSSNQNMDGNRYAVMLAIWPEAPFSTKSALDETTQSLKDRAFEGSDFEQSAPLEWPAKIVYIIASIMVLFGLVLVLKSLFSNIRKNYVLHRYPRNYVFTRAHNFKPTVKKDYCWSDIPYDGSPFDICCMTGSVIPGALDAVILSWIAGGHMSVVQRDIGKILPNLVSALVLQVENPPQFLSKLEETLWNMLEQSAGSDHELLPDEFKKWAIEHKSEVSDWVTEAKETSEELVEERGLMMWQDIRVLWKDYETVKLTEQGQEFVNRCFGFKNFLTRYLDQKDLESLDTKMLDRYMMWAAMFGVSKKVSRKFKWIAPEYEKASKLNAFNVLSVHTFGHNVHHSGYVSDPTGSGGMASFGGGGGASGGGGGGGVR